MRTHSLVVFAIVLLAAISGCRDGSRQLEAPPVPSDPLRSWVEGFVAAVDDDLRAHAEAMATGHAITALLDKEARRPWNARLQGGIKYADLFQKIYDERGNHKAFARSDGMLPRGEKVVAMLAAADTHAMDPAPYHIARIQTLSSELQKQARGEPQWETVTLEGAEAEALLTWMREQKINPHDAQTRRRVLDALLGVNMAPEEAPAPRIVERVAQFRQQFADSAELTAELELRIADGALRYARDMKHFNYRRLNWQELKEAGGGKTLIYGRLKRSFEELAEASPDEVDEVFAGLEPQHPQYDKLVDALARYRTIAADGGWKRVRSTSLELGAKSPRVAALRERLAAEGFLELKSSRAAEPEVMASDAVAKASEAAGESQAGGFAADGAPRAGAREAGGGEAPPSQTEPAYDPEVVDEALIEAVKSYQESHQFRPNGDPTPGFWRSLNVPVSRRIAQIELTLQRWRESLYEGEKDFVFVNIPDFHAEVYRDGVRRMRFRVVTGNNQRKCDPETEKWVYPNATPTQMAHLDHIILNPYWNVPDRIFREEIEPEMKRDASYLEKHNYELIEDARGRVRARQKPGEDNALGRVKFIFPNPHNTYMHDTPKKKYFNYPVRAFSHGCMRVQNPLDLAEYLMTEYDLGGRERLDRALESGKTIKVEFEKKLPVFSEYYTVRVDDQGRTNFLADIYRKDKARLSDDPEAFESCQIKRRKPVVEDEEDDGESDAPDDADDDLGP